MPREFFSCDSLVRQCLMQPDMVESNHSPSHQYSCSSQVQEPVEHSQGTVGQAHIRQRGHGRLKQYANVRDAVLCGAEEDFGRLFLECQGVQDPRPGKHGLVGGGEGRGQHDCVDNGWDGGDSCPRSCNHEGALAGRSVSVCVAQL